MLSKIGILSTLISTILSFLLVYQSFSEVKSKNNIIPKKFYYLSFYQLLFIIFSFLILLFGYIFSDFSLINVYENSHTTKPLFYKITGTWGNHEGSLLLWINIMVLFSFLFLVYKKNTEKKFKLFTLIFQNILILFFLIFLLTNSNPFSEIYPAPSQGMGLNPILQDPALGIHPPLLYLGFVSSSIYFSAALASLICRLEANVFAKFIKLWVVISWSFQTLGILVGSIWAYYELGWGGYWFWDPVENSSLMPWFLMTALFHSLLVLEKKNGLYAWVLILSILTFIMSVTGTFLVRSGILNSVHTFANDPSRGLFILIFLAFMISMSLIILFKYFPNEKNNFLFLSKESFVLFNNWFMIFFLTVVLIGTLYPLFLEVLSKEKVSVGPAYYNIVLAPFIVPFLFLMSYGPQSKWFSSKLVDVKKMFFIILLSFSLVFIFANFEKDSSFITTLILVFSIYLILQSFLDLYTSIKNNSFNLSRSISHLGFGMLIFFISTNNILSTESNFNLKVGETKKLTNYSIKFNNLKILKEKNYETLVGNFLITDIKNYKEENLKPEIRVYNQPKIVTYESSIKSKILSDTYLTMSNLAGSEFYSIRFQTKPFMNLIWISVLIISAGGFLRILRRENK